VPTSSPTPSGAGRADLPGELLAAAVRRNAAAPLLTAYDDATGDRVELSGATLANWVAKTANLLQEEFDVGPGSTVAVALPVHWQTAAVLLATWSCGAAVLDTAGEDDDRLAGADVVLTDRGRLPALEDALGPDPAAELLGLSLHPLGLGMTDYVGPARDFALEVRAHGDFFSPWQQLDPASPGLVTGGLTLALGGLVAAAGELAGRLGIRPDDRVLVDADTAAEAGPVAWLLAPLVAGASTVLVRHPAAEGLAHRAATERVTATLGVRIDGVRMLGAPG